MQSMCKLPSAFKSSLSALVVTAKSPSAAALISLLSASPFLASSMSLLANLISSVRPCLSCSKLFLLVVSVAVAALSWVSPFSKRPLRVSMMPPLWPRQVETGEGVKLNVDAVTQVKVGCFPPAAEGISGSRQDLLGAVETRLRSLQSTHDDVLRE